MYNNGSGTKRPRLTVDQICSNVASSQLEPIATTRTDSLLSRPHQLISTAYTSSERVASASTPLLPPSGSPISHEALNLSISNRCSPSTPTSNPGSEPVAASHRDSWPPPERNIYRGTQEYRNRRDSADFSDVATSSSSKSEDTTDEAGKERRRRQKLANKDNLFCQVCGDKANGYNFGAITCESCKAFFRRNAQKNKDLKCNFDNACKIDHFTRKFCTACRLNKCFSVNMKKEWILDEDALKKRKKLTRRSMKDESSSNDYDPIAFPTLPTSQLYGASNLPLTRPTGLFMYMDPQLTSLPTTGLPAAADQASSSEDKDYPTIPLTDEDKAEIERIMDSHAMIDSTSTSSSAVTTPTGTLPANTLLPASARGMTEAAGVVDTSAPPQIVIKTEPSSDPILVVEPEDVDKKSSADSVEDEQILNFAGGFISRLIKFVRFLPEFSELSQRDQVALLKGGIMETLVIRSAIVHEGKLDDPRASNAETKDGGSPTALTKEMVSKHMKFIKNFNTISKWDKPTMVLAMIVNLFSPDRLGIEQRGMIAKAAERYAYLLQAYLRSKYTFNEARALYPQLLLTLNDVRSYGELSSQQMVRVTLADLEPLMREMFSMK